MVVSYKLNTTNLRLSYNFFKKNRITDAIDVYVRYSCNTTVSSVSYTQNHRGTCLTFVQM